jgi:hypothetical protein
MLAVIASRKELQMDSEGATDLGVTAVQSLIWQPRSRKSRPTV